MTALALVLSGLITAVAAILRFGGASLVRTPRADALHDAVEGRRGADIVAELLEDRTILQPSLGMVHAALLVAAAIPGAWALSALLSGWGLLASLVGLGAVIVFLGDLLPRSLGRARPGAPAYRVARMLEAAVRLGDRASDLIQDEEEEAPDQPDHGEQEMELITQVLEFTDAIVREVMIPRTDMVTVPSSSDTDHALDVVIAEGRSRVPVTGDDIDDIVGVFYAKDLLDVMDSGSGPRPVSDLMRPATFVPESKRVSELLRELQRDQVHLAIVVDEFGSTAGLVTIEDLLEEIVGEIVDEYDVEEPMVEALPEGGYLVDARMPVDDLGELVEAELPGEEWDTVGGLLLGLAGRIPREGETFEYDRLELVADRVQGRRISRVLVRIR